MLSSFTLILHPPFECKMFTKGRLTQLVFVSFFPPPLKDYEWCPASRLLWFSTMMSGNSVTILKTFVSQCDPVCYLLKNKIMLIQYCDNNIFTFSSHIICILRILRIFFSCLFQRWINFKCPTTLISLIPWSTCFHLLV